MFVYTPKTFTLNRAFSIDFGFPARFLQLQNLSPYWVAINYSQSSSGLPHAPDDLLMPFQVVEVELPPNYRPQFVNVMGTDIFGQASNPNNAPNTFACKASMREVSRAGILQTVGSSSQAQLTSNLQSFNQPLHSIIAQMHEDAVQFDRLRILNSAYFQGGDGSVAPSNSFQLQANGLMQMFGRLLVGSPVGGADAAPRSYVDAAVSDLGQDALLNSAAPSSYGGNTITDFVVTAATGGYPANGQLFTLRRGPGYTIQILEDLGNGVLYYRIGNGADSGWGAWGTFATREWANAAFLPLASPGGGTIALGAGWTNVSGAYLPQYIRQANGLTVLRGLFQPSASGGVLPTGAGLPSTLGTLPAAARPSATIYASGAALNTISSIRLLTTGEVQLYDYVRATGMNASTQFVGVDGIAYWT